MQDITREDIQLKIDDTQGQVQPTRQELKQKYELDDETKLKTAKIIYDRYTHDKIPTERPLAVIVLGQAGAGKTGLMAYSSLQFPNLVSLDIDDLRNYHPKYEEIKAEHPEIFQEVTGSFASQMMAILTPNLISPSMVEGEEFSGKHYSVLLHKTRGTGEIINDTLIPLQNAGYDTILRVIACHELESKMSCLSRSQAERNMYGCCRWVELPYQNTHYSGIVDLAAKIEEETLANAIEVYVRGEKITKPTLEYSVILNDHINSNQSVRDGENNLAVSDYNTDKFVSTKDAITKLRERELQKTVSTIPERLKVAEDTSKFHPNDRDSEFINELIKLSQQCGVDFSLLLKQ